MNQALVDKLIEQKDCLAIMGPTACGKSSLSMALAEKMPIEIISVDSALIYQTMDIGTAKPTEQEREQVPHHLINIISPEQSYSAAEFVKDVHRLVKDIFARGRLPVFVGGTMMYFNALQKGMAQLPESNPNVRAKIFNEWQASPEKTHQRMAEIDPAAGKRIHFNDSQRVVRALEVYQATRKSISQLQQEAEDNSLKEFSLKKIALMPENRAEIHKNITLRFRIMLEKDFLAEVSRLMKNEKLHPDLSAIRCVGYRQAWSYLLGEYDYETFVEKTIVATRQLAKRQITWLRKETDLLIIDSYQKNINEQLEQIELLLNRD